MIQVPPLETSTRTFKDFSLLKISFIGILAFVSAFGAAYFFSIVNFILGAVLLVVFGLFFTLQTILVEDKGKVVVLTLLESVAVAAPFFSNLTAQYVALMFLVFILLVSASLSARKEMENSFKIPFFRVSRTSLTNGISAVLLFVGAIYLGLAGGQFLNDKQFKLLINDAIAPALKIFVPVYKPEMSAGDFFADIVLRNLPQEERGLFDKAPADLKNQLVSTSVAKLAKSFEGYLGGPINLKNTLPDVIYKSINSRVSKLEGDARILLALGALLLLWFLIHSTVAFPLVYIPISVLGYLLYEALLMFGFAYVHLEMRNREVIVLK